MTVRYLNLGKFMILLLAIGAPVLIWQGYGNQKALVLRDAALRATLPEERQAMIHQVVSGFLTASDRLDSYRLKRRMPTGPIEGLPAFPGPEVFKEVVGVKIGTVTQVDARILDLLSDSSNFFSGMPKAYAGMVECLASPVSIFSQQDFDQLYQAMSRFWRAEDIDQADYGFLLARLPETVRDLLYEQWAFTGQNPAPASMGFLAMIETNGERRLLALPDKARTELNKLLEAFELDTVFMPSENWLDLQGIQLTLVPEPVSSGPLRHAALFYGGACAAAELLLLLLFGVLTRYEKVNRTQKQLLATTSHELRTPLAVMRQFSEMLLDRKDQIPAKYRPYHQHIHRECMKMQFLVENLLSAARFEYFKFNPKPGPIKLHEWLPELIDSVSRLSEQTINLECPGMTVHWDAGLMSQALVNLLENARVHAATAIDVTVTGSGDRVEVAIRDYGEKVDVAGLKKIRVFNGEKQSKQGLGLGLYLVQRIIEGHEGSLDFQGADPGLRVLVRMPKTYVTPAR